MFPAPLLSSITCKLILSVVNLYRMFIFLLNNNTVLLGIGGTIKIKKKKINNARSGPRQYLKEVFWKGKSLATYVTMNIYLTRHLSEDQMCRVMSEIGTQQSD